MKRFSCGKHEVNRSGFLIGVDWMLEVVNSHIRHRSADGCKISDEWNVTEQRCWCIRVVAKNGSAAIPMEFAREKDARRAMESIQGLDSWDGTLAEISERLQKMTKKELKRRMVDSLAW